MRALSFDDLMPLEEYVGRRKELFDAQCRYLDRYRRVRVGPCVTLIFENRQTLWFRVQEILRIARLVNPARVQRELDIHNRLLPDRDHLQAAFLIDIKDEANLVEELRPWQCLCGEDVALVLEREHYLARLITSRPEDRCLGASHWIQFKLDERARRLLGDLSLPAHFEITLPDYRHRGVPLGEDVRMSLLDDLALSDSAA